MRIAAVVALLLSMSTAEADRHAPFALREAVLGCWDVGDGARLELGRFGKHGIRFRARFAVRPRGGPATMAGIATFVAADGEYELPCRPRSIHGGFCRIAPDGRGGLRVRVFAFRHGNARRGVLRALPVASRCRRS